MTQSQQYSGCVVTDRHVAISEPIYGIICRGQHGLDQKHIDMALRRIDLLVYCRPPTLTIIGTIDDRPQMEGVVDNTPAIITAYDEFFETVPANRWEPYDFTTHTEQGLLERIAHHVS